MQKEQLEVGEFDWWSHVNLFGEHIGHEALAAAEVPQLPMSLPSNNNIQYNYRPTKVGSSMPYKKAFNQNQTPPPQKTKTKTRSSRLWGVS